MRTKLILGFLLVVVLVGSGYLYSSMEQKILSSRKDATDLRSQLAQTNAKLDEANSQLKMQAQVQATGGTATSTPAQDTTIKLQGLDLSRFQAVHLTNGIVYFGKITQATSNFVNLTDIYYMQNGYADPSTNTQQQISLVKRGNELHAPADSMEINLVNINYIETLKDSSPVLQAIYAYEVAPK